MGVSCLHWAHAKSCNGGEGEKDGASSTTSPLKIQGKILFKKTPKNNIFSPKFVSL